MGAVRNLAPLLYNILSQAVPHDSASSFRLAQGNAARAAICEFQLFRTRKVTSFFAYFIGKKSSCPFPKFLLHFHWPEVDHDPRSITGKEK